MSRSNVTTPGRGETMYQGATPDTNNLLYSEYEGVEKVFEDINWSDRGVKSTRSNRMVRCRLVRNLSGITLLGKRLVSINPTTHRITGYTRTSGQECYPLDEFLPATGVPNGDLCWIVVSGPAVVLTPFVGTDFGGADFAAGDILQSGTVAAASTATASTTTPGRPAVFTVAAATTAGQFTSLINYLQNGRLQAMSARTTGETHSDLLVRVLPRDQSGD